MRSHRRVGSRAPLAALISTALVVLLLPSAVMGAGWSPQERVTGVRGSRLDSLHQLTAGRGALHLVHPRIGPRKTDDRVVYQRSRNGGATWTRERTLFSATAKRRHVVPNMAVAAKGNVVVVAWRVAGPGQTTLFARTSLDGGSTFGGRVDIFSTDESTGIGVPAVTVGNDVVAVAWTDRANGKIKIRTSRNDGRTFKPARTLGRTRMSIDCKRRVTDGLVSLAAADKRIHVAWSHANKRACQAGSIKVRSSNDRGSKWKRVRMVTNRRSYGWPELAVRGRMVMATVQSPSGAIIVARSTENGRKWRDQLIKPRKGRSLSAADVVLLPRGRAQVAYVDERIRKSRLINTKLVSRRSFNDGRTFKKPQIIAPTAKRFRMAPNLAANGSNVTVVFQAGALDGSPRNLYASRWR